VSEYSSRRWGDTADWAAAWQALASDQGRIAGVHLRELFAADSQRFNRYSLSVGSGADQLLIDYSKHRFDATTLRLLLDLARVSGVEEAKAAMFAGQRLNTSEDRAVLHVALRDPHGPPLEVAGEDVRAAVAGVLARVRDFSDAVRSGAWRGHRGDAVTDVVNIGIGGSHLGPQMVVRALRPYATGGPRVHFVANVDGAAIEGTLADLDPARTLFLVASKTFTTQETMRNAHTARAWLTAAMGSKDAVASHFVALSTNAAGVSHFGIDPANMFEFWDWVGGRYSLWSAVGLSIAISVGFQRFEELLAGARLMDSHFAAAPMAASAPVLLAMLGVWYRDFQDAETHAVLPYDESLEHLPAFLQQLDMESNGKRVTHAGTEVPYPTGPILFGQSGTNGQHAFYQLIHQGTAVVPADFIAAVRPHHDLAEHHALLLANFVAQTEALMRGRTPAETRALLGADAEASLVAAKSFPGNRPSTSIVMPQLTPTTLGMLIALYEHKVFVQGVVWDVNSFDQMGVELGKELANALLPEVAGAAAPADSGTASPHDPSTLGLLAYLREHGRRG